MHLPQKPVAFCLVGEDPKPLGADEATASSSGKSGSFKKGREAWKMIEQISGQMVAAKKRRGKPQDRSKLTRNKIVQIRMTEEEVSRLKEAAVFKQKSDKAVATLRQKGLSLDAYVSAVEQMQKKAKRTVNFSLMTPEERIQYYLKRIKENQKTANMHR